MLSQERKILQTENSLFRAWLEYAPDAMVIINQKGKIELINAQAEKLFGYMRQELVGNEVEMLVPARFRKTHRLYRTAFIEAPDIRQMGSGLELFAQRKNGTECRVEIALSYIKDNAETYICAAIRDISEKKELEKFKAQLASIVTHSNDAIISETLDGIIVSWNEAAVKAFGYQPAEVLGKNIEMLVPPDKKEEMQRLTKSIINGRQTGHIETVRVTKNGERIHVSLTISAIKNDEGEITGISKILRDVTLHKETQEKINTLNKEKQALEEKLVHHRQLEDFAYITSHNLRSPVGNLNSLFLIYDSAADTEAKENVVNKIRTVTRHLTTTLNELSRAMNIKTDVTIARDNLDFKLVLEKITESNETLLVQAGVTLTYDFSSFPRISYPATYLESIMLNFLTNAIKYRSPKRKPVIHFETALTKDGPLLLVTDNGLGIDLNRHGTKIFGLHKTFHRNEDAKGVGLFITKAQVEAMGGRVSVKSEPDKGTTFYVYFTKRKDI